ncbi:hypothetical protein LOC68_06340 [Blastopirellula sp. JC732]|uniref:Capsule assembly Wzi family protein n=1 Tax=Blastopirellula sediminis TaxID=2894196 RepID=A0A9X1MKJ8_9BACT|nr:hypothetical protein [Blastopirellula sediminis]MCC9628007.1 hypothetical protein [Blastopirellula sediminis]
MIRTWLAAALAAAGMSQLACEAVAQMPGPLPNWAVKAATPINPVRGRELIELNPSRQTQHFEFDAEIGSGLANGPIQLLPPTNQETPAADQDRTNVAFMVPSRKQATERLLPPTDEYFTTIQPLPESIETPAPIDDPDLPPLEEELWNHGGSYLYCPEGDRLGWPTEEDHDHYELLRLPENFVAPLPLTYFAQFLGNDPIKVWDLTWFRGYNNWEPRFVGYGSYELIGLAYKQGTTRQDAIGHQLIADFDLQLTGTERFHLQFRPIGKGNTGGSYYQFNDPAGYVDNSTGEPTRYWFEGELASIFGGYFSPFAVRDIFVTAGRFPFALQNGLLMNDEMLGVVVNKNTIYVGNISNINVQGIYAATDVRNTADPDSGLFGVNVTADYDRELHEFSALALNTPDAPGRNQQFVAYSRTKFYGPVTLTGRAMFKFGDEAGIGEGQLFVLESNLTRYFEHEFLGIDHCVYYCNAFYARDGWNPAGSGNYNRLRTAFEVDPLVQIASGRTVGPNSGVALGVQYFRHHEDESIIPEIAFEAPTGDPVWGFGLRYLRKTSQRTYFEALGVINFSETEIYRRDGISISETILF